MKLRPGTTDQCVYDEVITRNCYRVPESLANQVVIDIGAHIGCFSKLCAERGAIVYAYEIEPDNISYWLENLELYRASRASLFSKAVWNIGGIHVNQSGPYDTADGTLKNTGSSHVVSPAGPHTPGAGKIETITLDEILEPFERVALVKIDAEGAEFEIVPATKSWAKVDRLVGEVHGYRKEYHVPNFYMEVRKHFPNLEVNSYCPEYGLETFFAWR